MIDKNGDLVYNKIARPFRNEPYEYYIIPAPYKSLYFKPIEIKYEAYDDGEGYPPNVKYDVEFLKVYTWDLEDQEDCDRFADEIINRFYEEIDNNNEEALRYIKML